MAHSVLAICHCGPRIQPGALPALSRFDCILAGAKNCDDLALPDRYFTNLYFQQTLDFLTPWRCE